MAANPLTVETVIGLLQAYAPASTLPRPGKDPVSPDQAGILELRIRRGGILHLSTRGSENKEVLTWARKGDRITAQVNTATQPWNVVKLVRVERRISKTKRLIFIAITMVLIVFIAALFTHWDLRRLLVGSDNRYSNSHFQIVVWFFVMCAIYGGAFGLRIFYLGPQFIRGIDIPQNLLVLTGLSAFSFGGAKLIVAQKADAKGAPVVPRQDAPRLSTDLVMNSNGKYDFGDFQMLMITLAAVVIYGLTGFQYLGWLPLEKVTILPDVDTTLLSGFGIGQGAYLIKKAASKLGDG